MGKELCVCRLRGVRVLVRANRWLPPQSMYLIDVHKTATLRLGFPLWILLGVAVMVHGVWRAHRALVSALQWLRLLPFAQSQQGETRLRRAKNGR